MNEETRLIAQLYNDYAKRLIGIAMKNHCSLEVAKDIVQEIFVTALQNADELISLDPSQQYVWLLTALRNKVNDTLQ